MADNVSRSQYELNQTIYVNTGYARLLDLINGYLTRFGWYVGEDYEDCLRRIPAHKRWKYGKQEGSVGLVVYKGRNHYSLVGSGLGIRVLHVRRFIQDGTRRVSSIPRAIRSRLDHIPNVVEIDSHRSWSFEGNQLAFHLAQYLVDRGCQSCMACPSGESVYVKRNPLLTAQQRIEPVAESDPVFRESEVRLWVARSLLESAVPDVWIQSSEEVRRFLVTGMFLYQRFEVVRQTALDMSPVSIEFIKAIETIVAECILLPFRAWYTAHRRWAGASLEREIKDTRFRRLANFLQKSEPRTPEIGALWFLLRTLRTHRKRNFTLLKAFREFALRFKDPDYILLDNDLMNTLEEITTKYRKGISHTEPQSFEMADRLLKLLMGEPIVQYGRDRNCFLQRLVRATRVVRD